MYLSLHPYATWNAVDWLIMLSMSLTKLSGEAVIFFFVLSGFSIAHSLTAQPSPKIFLQKRFIRLYPTYIFGFILALLSVLLLKTNYDLFLSGKYATPIFDKFKNSLVLFDWRIIVKTLLYQPELGTVITPYWSLVYEVIFYICAIFFVKDLITYYRISLLMFISGIVLEIFHVNFIEKSILLKFVFQYNFYFMVGIYLYNNYEKVKAITFFNFRYWPLLLLSFYIIMIGVESRIGERIHLSFIIAALTCVYMIIRFLDENIEFKLLQHVGKFSYTLYIVHFSVITFLLWFIYVVLQWQPPYIYNYFVWIPAVFICVGVSYLAYLLVEKPTQRLLSRLRKR